MSYTFRATFPALFLSLILPCALPALAADPTPDPAKDAAAQAPVERAPLLSRSQEDAIALERQLPREDQQQLQAGDDSFLALWKPANTEAPEGAVIIVPGEAESPDWPDAVGPLRRKFPDVGWSSLSITMPDPLDNTPGAREPDVAPADANAAKATEAPKENPKTPRRQQKTRPQKPRRWLRLKQPRLLPTKNSTRLRPSASSRGSKARSALRSRTRHTVSC